jgi:hypothetical protein
MGGEKLLGPNLTEFFRGLVQSAMSTHEVHTSEASEFYLVSLLEKFAHPPARWFERPLALDYLESLSSPGAHRHVKLKHVADTSLFLSGLFMEMLERTLTGPTYYVDLGRMAYGRLAVDGTVPGAWPFAELAQHFEAFVRVLSEISFTELFPSDDRLVRAYRRWLLTGSERDRAWLARQGLVPIRGTERRH